MVLRQHMVYVYFNSKIILPRMEANMNGGKHKGISGFISKHMNDETKVVSHNNLIQN